MIRYESDCVDCADGCHGCGMKTAREVGEDNDK